MARDEVPGLFGLAAPTLPGVTGSLMLAPLGPVPLAAAGYTMSAEFIMIAAGGVGDARAGAAPVAVAVAPPLAAGGNGGGVPRGRAAGVAVLGPHDGVRGLLRPSQSL